MAKVIGTVKCTHCDKEHDAEIDLDNLPKISNAKLIDDAHNHAVEKQVTELTEQVKKLSEKPAEESQTKKGTVRAPAFIKKAKCRHCNKLHDNELYEGPVKGKCDNCGQLSTRSKGKCPFCKPGEIEAMDSDDIESLELYSEDEENEEEHDHE